MFPGVSREHSLRQHERRSITSTKTSVSRKIKQGNLFTQKPLLACVACNTGWMNKFDDDVSKFLRPALNGKLIELTSGQSRTLAGWIGLITILSEYVSGGEISVANTDRRYFRQKKQLPDNWSIFVCGLNGTEWSRKYDSRVMAVFDNPSVSNLFTGDIFVQKANSQISSFGMGKLFFHVFSCPNVNFLSDFESAAKSRGMVQLWPPVKRFWFFTKRRTQIPSYLTLNDDEATELSDSFHSRLEYRTAPERMMDKGRTP